MGKIDALGCSGDSARHSTRRQPAERASVSPSFTVLTAKDYLRSLPPGRFPGENEQCLEVSCWRGQYSTVAVAVYVGALRNDGVAALVQQTPNSIGYVELTYAIQHELSFGAVRNAAGAYVNASLESVGAAAQSAPTAAGGAPSITDAPGKAAYPIASFTWIVLPEPMPSGQRNAIAQMLQWMLTSGQKQSSALGYAPLPRELASGELQALAQLE